MTVFAVLVLLATACGASAGVEVVAEPATDSASSDTSSTETTASEPALTEATATDSSAVATQDTTVGVTDDDAVEAASDNVPGPLGIGDGVFELVLEDGTTFSAPIQCVLQPQLAAGAEILFTAGGDHEGLYYDVTQWGETSFGASQDVEITDSGSFDTLWRSTGSTGLVLELNGNVITGSGGFYQGENLNGPQTQGELTVSC